ncbi:MAG: DUF1998 domain-containing protein [Verrucomicrobiia bacterium]
MEDTDFDSLCAGLSADDARRLRKIFVEWCDGDENGFPVQMALLTRAQWQAAASIPRSLNDSRKWLELHLAEYRRQTAELVKNLSAVGEDQADELKNVTCTNSQEFERFEPRLSALLRVARFCAPPDYRAFRRTNPADQPPPNANLFVPALRFPRWYRQTRTGEMRRFNLDAAQLPNPQGGGRWQPVRFVSVCSAGHLCEFPWKQWIGCQCADDGNLFLTDRGGSELSSIRIECRTCPDGSSGRQGRSLAGTTIKPNVALGEQSAFQRAGIPCPGDRPWLGEGANEQSCNQPLIAGLINQTNLYFPKTISAIALPDLRQVNPAITTIRNEIASLPTVGVARTVWNMGDRAGTVAMVKAGLDVLGIVSDPALVQEWASRYLLVHSLAHILINQLVFECGYSTASLRERLYVSPDSAAPMAALMIYTAAGDAEGTLGGLVRLGRPERLGPVVRRALGRASWCSADPVCSEHLGGQGSKLANLAACHACVLLPETSCETINQGLDRAMVVGTPDAREQGFMAELLEEAYSLG